jgi:dienelactone hydrolase
MRWRRAAGWTAGVLAVILAAGGIFVWLSLNGSLTRKYTPEALIALLAPDIVVVKPEGDGPFPAVLMYSGCEGLWDGAQRRPLMGIYADIAVSEGVVAIIVDSLKPRGIDSSQAYRLVCPGLAVRGAARAGDVAVTIAWARALPFVDPEKIALAGWSHGGWAIMDMLAMRPDSETPQSLTAWPDDTFAGLRGMFLVYPYCGFPALAPWRGFAEPLPAWAIHGTDDATADPAPCDRAYGHLVAAGVPVAVEVVEGATHAFDRPDVLPSSSSKYDPAFAAIAHDQFRRFLREVLLAPWQ